MRNKGGALAGRRAARHLQAQGCQTKHNATGSPRKQCSGAHLGHAVKALPTARTSPASRQFTSNKSQLFPRRPSWIPSGLQGWGHMTLLSGLFTSAGLCPLSSSDKKTIESRAPPKQTPTPVRPQSPRRESCVHVPADSTSSLKCSL